MLTTARDSSLPLGMSAFGAEASMTPNGELSTLTQR
jgi:hypothetical protein